MFNNEWMNDLKVGDDVYIITSGGSRRFPIYRHRRIARVTKTRVVVKITKDQEMAFMKKTGRMVGEHQWAQTWHRLEEFNEKNQAQHERYIKKARHIAKCDELRDKMKKISQVKFENSTVDVQVNLALDKLNDIAEALGITLEENA